MKDTRTRKWQITINNPLEKGFTHDFIKAQLEKFKSCVYWCMSDDGLLQRRPLLHGQEPF